MEGAAGSHSVRVPKKVWREVVKGILFTTGDIVEAAEKAENEAD
jgi:hypothetical protein